MWFGGGLSGAIGTSCWRIVRHEGNLRRFSGRPLLRISFHDASCLDVFVIGVFRIRIEVIVIEGELTTVVINDVCGGRPACPEGRIMDFRRRLGPDEPNAHIFEDVPDDQRILDGTDDPHGPLKFRTNQRIDLVNLLYQTRPIPTEDFFIPLRFDDGGNGVIGSFLLPFPP